MFKHQCISSKKLRDSARDEECTLNIAGVCNYDNATVVLCHINLDGGKMGGKTDDYSAAFGCSACHAALDSNAMSREDWLFYASRGVMRTLRRWIEIGLVVIR